ncbi:MAG TPA: patatin-like phospholipase family protein [Solimonas sp.]|nr:patatin-like phospholipase family protein [Solimonas sp.]
MSAPDTKALLKLQRMDMSLVRAVMAHQHFLLPHEYHRLRYILGFARLHRFAPGAALRQQPREEVEVDSSIVAPVRELVLRELFKPLRREDTARLRLAGCMPALEALHAAVRVARDQLLARHQNDFSAEELDAEVGRKALVTIAGGGGGAGYVYIGAAARLRAEGRSSDYLVGASIGALIGAFLARSRTTDIEAVLTWAKSLRMRDIFGRPYLGATHTLPGITRLHLRSMHKIMSHPDGTPLRLKDLEIPYDAVIAGIRTRAYDHLPSALRDLTSPLAQHKSFSRLFTERMLLLATFVNPNVTRPIVLGRDAATRDMRVADAVGLSAAIPAVLQYEPPERDPRSDEILAALREQHDVALFVDGGVAANVPARIAWEGVQAGRIGTRNAFYLALDCFSPQWDPRHLWLWPVTQAVQLQMPAQRHYFDWLMRFTPTLSPINLLPPAQDFEKAFKWGWDQADVMLPFLLKALEPVEWKP